MNAQQHWRKARLQARNTRLGMVEAFRESRRWVSESQATRLAAKADYHDKLATHYRTMKTTQDAQTTAHETARDDIRAQRIQVQQDIDAIMQGARYGAPVNLFPPNAFEAERVVEDGIGPDPLRNLT